MKPKSELFNFMLESDFLLEVDNEEASDDVGDSLNASVDGSDNEQKDNSSSDDNTEDKEDTSDEDDNDIDEQDSENDDEQNNNLDDAIGQSDNENYRKLKLLKDYESFYNVAKDLASIIGDLDTNIFSDSEYEIIETLRDSNNNTLDSMKFIITNTFENEKYEKLLYMFINFRSTLKLSSELIQKLKKSTGKSKQKDK